jgi:3-hydroxybutyryl-CoA dehydratase
LNEHAFSSINKGDIRVFRKKIDEGLIAMFGVVTGDINPLHLDDEFARQTLFGGKIAHGMFTASLISAALSTFPGVVVYLSQNLRFIKPVRPGDEIEAIAIVIEKREEENELLLQTLCRNQKDETVLEGEARIRIL